MCDKKNIVLFTETECHVLSLDFKLLDASQVLLRVPRQSNMYNFDLKNVVPFGDLTCLFAKPNIDESKLWHRRLGHVNFKTMNKLVKGNLVRGLPSKTFENDHTCVACVSTIRHMPPLADLSFAGLDDYVYRPTTNKTGASKSQVETSISQTSNTSVEMPRVESVRPTGVIIEDWVSDDDEDIF
ncbi:ribonuclease H-like domain-containing protein [Tanacetum coccineum]